MITTLRPQFTWKDRRPIAAIHVADAASPSSETNPSKWLWDTAIDVITPQGQANFAERMKKHAENSIAVMTKIGAQGMIVWEIDGARYGTYLGSPDIAVALNPELYQGRHGVYGEIGGIVDDFFASFRSAGFKVGVCLRPDEFNLETKKMEPSPDPYKTLLRKAQFARETWKCKLFYVDSNVRTSLPTSALNAWQWGAILPAVLFAQLHKALPDCLFIPEHEDESYYLFSAPYLEAQGNELETPANIRESIPDAFSVININNHKPEDFPKLLDANKRGDILLLNGWWESDDVKSLIEAQQTGGK